MHYLISYLIFNVAIAISYVTARSTLEYCLSFQHLYKQRLKLARFALLAIISAFWIMPHTIAWLLIDAPSKSLFQPFIRHASDHLSSYYSALPAASESIIKQAVLSMTDIDTVIISFLLLAIGLGFAYQIKNAFLLVKSVKHSYRIRKIGSVSILLNDIIQVPICFSFLHSSYVILPNALVENQQHFKLAVAHELQHIRQKDTRWLYLLMLLKVICIINPFIWLWARWFNELQEYACDESIIKRKNTSAVVYGQCLLDTARNITDQSYSYNVLSLTKFKQNNIHSNLYRRVEMLFQHHKNTNRGLFSMIAGILLALSSLSTAYALNGSSNPDAITMPQLQTMVNAINKNSAITVAATPEVLAQINAIRTDPKAKAFMTASLQRMAQYKPMIAKQLQQYNMPENLLALPLTESGYRNLDASKNILSAAGIWQFVPTTAHKYGLVINDTRDDRLTPELETKAAISYLLKLHQQFNNWNLAVVAYEIGEVATQQLIDKVGSRNILDLARSRYASEDLKQYVPALNASLIIMHNPSLIS